MSQDVAKLLNTIFLGEVASVQNYGAFIRIPGHKIQGLVHKSQISNSNVEDASEVLQKGDRVWCKTIRITDDGKLSLSMKVVDQGCGKDLDPNGVQMHQDEQRRREKPLSSGRKKIELEAVLNTTCTKCGTKGHLSKDCFKDPAGKTYELIPDEDDVPQPEPLVSEERKKDKKRHKKDKKSKKKKKKRYSSSSECVMKRNIFLNNLVLQCGL